MLAAATEEVKQLGLDDVDVWTDTVGQTAELVAVRGHRLEPEPGPSYHPDNTSPEPLNSTEANADHTPGTVPDDLSWSRWPT